MKLSSLEMNSPEFLLALITPMRLTHHPTKSKLGSVGLVSLGIGFSKVKIPPKGLESGEGSKCRKSLAVNGLRRQAALSR